MFKKKKRYQPEQIRSDLRQQPREISGKAKTRQIGIIKGEKKFENCQLKGGMARLRVHVYSAKSNGGESAMLSVSAIMIRWRLIQRQRMIAVYPGPIVGGVSEVSTKVGILEVKGRGRYVITTHTCTHQVGNQRPKLFPGNLL